MSEARSKAAIVNGVTDARPSANRASLLELMGLGILIPPSGSMVLFGVVSDTSIGALFMAGVMPGLMLAAIFAIYCMTSARLSRSPAATQPRASLREVIAALRRALWALTLPALVLGGMHFGVFTATEAAAAGAPHC